MYIKNNKTLSISFLKLWGGEKNHVRSISDQCYFYAKYDKNTSTIAIYRACFLKFL